MKKLAKVLLFIAALIPIIQLFEDGGSSILIFSVFVFVFLWKGLQKWSMKLPIPRWLQFIVFGALFGAFTQIMVQIEGFEKTFSADPIVHFFQALTNYIWVTIAWYILLKRYEFSTWSIFWITGVFGALIEGIVLYHYVNPLQWLFLFLVYGPLGALPYILTKEKFPPGRISPRIKHYFLALICLIVAIPVAHICVTIMWLAGIR